MVRKRQVTILNEANCYGIGIHSGGMVQLTIKPAKANTGIVFIRSDIRGEDNVVFARWDNVIETTLGTTVANKQGVSVATIEHLMAAIYGLGIDNLIIELDGPEVPIMDGSSKSFVFMIEYAQIQELSSYKKCLKILKQITVQDNHSALEVSPSNDFSINVNIDFTDTIIGCQSASLKNIFDFKEEIADARTFGFVKDLEYLKNKGLARGASLDNAIGIDNNKILNPEKLRFQNEFARHKLLDAVGDFATTCAFILGNFECDKPSHYVNSLLLKKIFSSKSNYQIYC